MRTMMISFAAAASALVVAAPASAQVFTSIGIGIGGQAYGNLGPAYGAPAYGAPYGNAYGYNRSGPAQWAREPQQIRMQYRNAMMQRRLSRSQARDVERDLRSAEIAVRRASARGMSPRQAQSIDRKIAHIRYELQRYANSRSGYGNRYGNGYRYR